MNPQHILELALHLGLDMIIGSAFLGAIVVLGLAVEKRFPKLGVVLTFFIMCVAAYSATAFIGHSLLEFFL